MANYICALFVFTKQVKTRSDLVPLFLKKLSKSTVPPLTPMVTAKKGRSICMRNH